MLHFIVESGEFENGFEIVEIVEIVFVFQKTD